MLPSTRNFFDRKSLNPRSALLALVGLLNVAPRFVFGALGVVVGLKRLAILVHSALTLPGNVEDLAQLDVAPDFGPLGVAISIEALAIRIGGGLVVLLQEEHVGHAVVSQGAVLVGIERLIELDQRTSKISLLN